MAAAVVPLMVLVLAKQIIDVPSRCLEYENWYGSCQHDEHLCEAITGLVFVREDFLYEWLN